MVTRQGCMAMRCISRSPTDNKLPRTICRSFYKKQVLRQHGTSARKAQGRSAARIPRVCLMRDAQVDTTPDPAAHALKVKHTNTQPAQPRRLIWPIRRLSGTLSLPSGICPGNGVSKIPVDVSLDLAQCGGGVAMTSTE